MSRCLINTITPTSRRGEKTQPLYPHYLRASHRLCPGALRRLYQYSEAIFKPQALITLLPIHSRQTSLPSPKFRDVLAHTLHPQADTLVFSRHQ